MPSLLWKILLGVAIGLVIIRGGGPALLRLALPVVVIYLGYKALQRLAATKLAELAQRMRDHQPGSYQDSQQGHQQTIEICPQCGHQRSPQNFCTCS